MLGVSMLSDVKRRSSRSTMPRMIDPELPIDDALPALTAALRQRNAAVLVAPPGAGKTTRVPLVLIDEPWAAGKKILVLEPRRLAARAAAERMAATLRRERRRHRRLCACASARRCRARPASRSSPKACSRG